MLFQVGKPVFFCCCQSGHTFPEIHNVAKKVSQVPCKFLFPGNEHFPTVWPPEVLELFGIQMSGKVQASVDHFDGTFNLLNITKPKAQGGSSINSIIVDALKKSGKSSTKSLTQDTQAQGYEQTQAGVSSSASAHNLPTETVNPKPQSLKKGAYLVTF